VIFLLALLPATALTIAGYFVLYFSQRAEGGLRSFGNYLGFWAFTLAGLVVLGALFAAAHGGHRGAYALRGMRGGMQCPWQERGRGGPRMDERAGPPPPPPAEPPGAAAPNAAEAPNPPPPAAH